MDCRIILALGLVVTSVVEGCLSPQSLSLSLSLFIGRKGQKSLQCLLCLDKKNASRRNFTFSLTRNEISVQFNQTASRKIWYLLDPKRNNSGLWRCNVQEFPELSDKYCLEPPTPAPPPRKVADDDSVAASTTSTRVLLTIVTAALLLTILIAAISFASGVCIRRLCRRKPLPPPPHHKDRQRSDNCPLTATVSSDWANPAMEPDTEVSYVELEIIRDPSRKPSKSHDTIYANIM